MARLVSRSAAFLVLALLALPPGARAVTRTGPNLTGVWKLDRDLTTARYVKDDTLVVTQTKQRVKFKYQTRDAVTGTDVFVTDGSEQNGYVTRIEKTYYRARWKAGELVIVTQHVLDIFGYQTYKETDRWVLAPDGKTLTEKLSDGHVAVYYWQGPAQIDTADITREFHAIGVYSENPHPSKDDDCQIDLDGTLKNSMVGAGTYQLCAVHEGGAAAVGDCTPLVGTLTFTRDDTISSFVLNVSGQFCSKEQHFLGTYEVDPNKITGDFNDHLSGGSGTLQFSYSTSTVVLYGVLLYE